MSTRCRCGHHARVYTYRRNGERGECLAGPHADRCDCTAYDPTEEDK